MAKKKSRKKTTRKAVKGRKRAKKRVVKARKKTQKPKRKRVEKTAIKPTRHKRAKAPRILKKEEKLSLGERLHHLLTEASVVVYAAKPGGDYGAIFVSDNVERLTGYIRGGVSPVGTKKACEVWIDQSAFDHAEISLSAGTRGLQMIIDPRDLERAVTVHGANLARR